VKGKEEKVYLLRKALYRLKQAPWAWNSKINSYFQHFGLQRSPNEPSLYVKIGEKGNFLVFFLYVDDIIYAGTDMKMVEKFKMAMMKEFEMIDLGLMKYFLGFQVKQSSGDIFILQEKYVEDLLKKFQMSTCKPLLTPMAFDEKLKQDDGAEMGDEKLHRSLEGSLIYLTNTRPDIVQSVSVLSRFMSKPSKIHYAAAKRVLSYVHRTKKMGLRYVKDSSNKQVGFIDSDWARSVEDRRSTLGYLLCLGSKLISEFEEAKHNGFIICRS